MSTDDYSSLLLEFQSLRLANRLEAQTLLASHRRAEDVLLHRLVALSTPAPRSVSPVLITPDTNPPLHHRDHYGTPLHLGDTVTLLTKAKSGTIGDSATVIRLKKSIGIRLHTTKTTTTRLARNLKRIATA